MKQEKSFTGKSLTKHGIRSGLMELYEKLRDDDNARKQFINNPSSLLGKALGHKLSSEYQVSEANRLLFSVLASPQFFDWYKEYVNAKPNPERGEYRQDLAQALLKYGDSNIFLAVVNNAAVNKGLPFLDEGANQNLFTGGLASDARSSQNFEQSSGASQRPTGLELDPRLSQVLITVAQALIVRAKELSESGILSDPGARIQ